MRKVVPVHDFDLLAAARFPVAQPTRGPVSAIWDIHEDADTIPILDLDAFIVEWTVIPCPGRGSWVGTAELLEICLGGPLGEQADKTL